MRRRLWPLLALALAQGRWAGAQVLPCPEFPVNTHTSDNQFFPRIASDAAGGFVVVWQGYGQDGSAAGVFGQRFDASGGPRGPEFRINTYTTGRQAAPAVASDAAGNFVVVWFSYGQDGEDGGVYAQRFDSSGTPRGPEFLVNSQTTESQLLPRVASSPAGGFVVAWLNVVVGGGHEEVFARRFSAAGVAQGPEFMVNTYTTGSQTLGLDVAVDGAGNFVVVWNSYDQDGSGWSVFGQRFDAAGVPQGPEFPVNGHTTGFQTFPAVAADPSGNFVVAWEDNGAEGPGGIFARRFDATGAPQGPDFQVNTYTFVGQIRPDVSFLGNGDFVVVWDSNDQDGSYRGVFGQRFSPSGAPLGPEFQVNSYTPSVQYAPSVAAGTNGGFTVAWAGERNTALDVFAGLDCARLYTVAPCRLADTRNPPGPAGGPPLAANSTRTFPAAGACGVPADARALALSVTAVNPTDVGDLRLYPAGQAAPLASAVNFAPGRTRAGNVVLPLGAGGQVSVQCDMPAGSSGQTHLLLDVFGYFKR